MKANIPNSPYNLNVSLLTLLFYPLELISMIQ